MTTASRIGRRWRRLETRSVPWKKRVGGCVLVVERVGSSQTHSRADPVAGNFAPRSFGRDDLLRETVGAFSLSRADPAGENAAPQSLGGEGFVGPRADHRVKQLKHPDPGVENEAPRSFGRDGPSAAHGRAQDTEKR